VQRRLGPNVQDKVAVADPLLPVEALFHGALQVAGGDPVVASDQCLDVGRGLQQPEHRAWFVGSQVAGRLFRGEVVDQPVRGLTGRGRDAAELLAATERVDDRVIEGADVWDVSRPRRRGAGRGLVVGVARWSSGCRCWGGHSAVTSATAARVEDWSTMALSAANAATRAWRARLFTARG
jgi:hypothetical protein